MSEIKAKVIKVLSNDEIVIDKKIRGTNIIRISNVDELLKDIEEDEKEELKKRLKANPLKKCLHSQKVKQSPH